MASLVKRTQSNAGSVGGAFVRPVIPLLIDQSASALRQPIGVHFNVTRHPMRDTHWTIAGHPSNWLSRHGAIRCGNCETPIELPFPSQDEPWNAV
jgi:hypothetical protein